MDEPLTPEKVYSARKGFKAGIIGFGILVAGGFFLLAYLSAPGERWGLIVTGAVAGAGSFIAALMLFSWRLTRYSDRLKRTALFLPTVTVMVADVTQALWFEHQGIVSVVFETERAKKRFVRVTLFNELTEFGPWVEETFKKREIETSG